MEFNQNQKLALLALVGVLAVGLGVGNRARHNGADNGIKIIQPADSVKSGKAKSSYLVVHVAGEVRSPGVYKLRGGSRVVDAINKAGGATLAGNTDSLNMAAPIKDGEKVLVPTKLPTITIQPSPTPPSLPQEMGAQANISVPAAAPTAASSTGKLKNPGEGVVNINSADSVQLQRLPGVGPSTAQKILEYRAQIGRFSLPDQIMDVKGIGPKKFEKMRPFICL